MEGENNKVGLYLDFIDIDPIYSACKHPRILQDISRGMDNLKDLLFTTVDKGNPLIDTRAVCECGATTSKHSSDDVCPICLSTIQPITTRSVTPSLYMGLPVGVSEYLSPYVYQSLRHAFDIGTKKQPYNPFVAILGNQGSSSPMHKVIKSRIPSAYYGYNNVLKDLPGFIKELVDATFDIVYPKERGVISSEITKSHKKKSSISPGLFEARELAYILETYKVPYASSVLPVRSKLLMTLEEGTYSNTSATTDLYSRAIVYLNNLPYEEEAMTPSDKRNYRPDSSITKFYERYSDFREMWYGDEGSKGGALRTDSITSRSGSVLRSVQAQNCNIHKGEELGLPYTQSIVVYHQHLVAWYKENKKWSADKIINFIDDHLREYDEELWTAINAIVQDISRMGGIAYTVRYPSIYRTSGLTHDVAFVKKDPNDRTLSVPASSLAGNNGDAVSMSRGNIGAVLQYTCRIVFTV